MAANQLSRPAARGAGFTLIELLVVVAIAGILVLIAMPAYEQMLRNRHRAEAVLQLHQLANDQHKAYTLNGAFTAVSSTLSEHGRYNIVQSVPNPDEFRITATAVADGPQADDDGCTVLSVDHLGNQTPLGCFTN